MGDNAGLMNKNPDGLTVPSRDFYENSIFKMFLSIVYFGVAFFYLGLCAKAAGESRSAYYQSESSLNDSDTQDGYQSIVAGSGFASFFFFVAFVLAVACSFHISPLTNGSIKERMTIRTPVDIER